MYTIETQPKWINDIEIDYTLKCDNARFGIDYLCVNEQHYVTKTNVSYFFQKAQRVVDEVGLNNIRHFSINFNPNIDSIKLHTLCLVRNNLEIIDLLKVENIQVVDSTQNHDNNIFDGQKILLILLQGLQVGDVIVSAYTTQRPYTSNAPKYSASINLNYLVPCAKVYRRVVSDVSEKLNYKLFNSSDSLAIKTDDFGNVSEIVFAKTNVTSVNFEDGLPAWNCPLAFLQVSAYDSWAEVAGLIYKFYMPVPQTSKLIQELCATFNSPESDLESNIINALRWVQNQIKYTSLELGDNNGLPVSPEIVLQRKFGDCKDKALLFLTILKEMQVEAYPVLIDSFSRIFKNCDDFLPSSLYFNHIIVKIVLNDVAYFVDPTRVFQCGSLDEYKQANIGAVLVLNPFAKKLEHSYAEISPSPLIAIQESFVVDKVDRNKLLFTTTSTYYKEQANIRRKIIANLSSEEIEQQRLQYFSRYYKKIEPGSPIRISDDQKHNQLTLTENYTIRLNKQTKGKNKAYSFLPIIAHGITPYLIESPRVQRKQPISLAFPLHISHVCKMIDPKTTLKGDKADIKIENKYFCFDQKRSNTNSHEITQENIFKTKTDYIEINDIESCLKDMDTVCNNCLSTLYFSKKSYFRKILPRVVFWLSLFVMISALKYFADSGPMEDLDTKSSFSSPYFSQDILKSGTKYLQPTTISKENIKSD